MQSVLKRLYFKILEAAFFSGRGGLENADAALRYLPISDVILASGLSSPSILEIGSGSTGITPYIPYRITGVDVFFEGDVSPKLDPVNLSGESLPFGDSTFDYVVSVDMLEHVPHDRRSAVIQELLRVARVCLFLAVPCGEDAEEHDRLLNDLYTARHRKPYTFLLEHVENGLPTEQEITQIIGSTAAGMGKKAWLRILPNVNLTVREWFSRVWIASPKTYGLISPLLCIFRRYYNFGRCYRSIFIVEIDADV